MVLFIPNVQLSPSSTFAPKDITSLLLFLDTDLLHDWVWWHYCAFVESGKKLIYYSRIPCPWRIYPGEGWTVSFRASHTLAIELQVAKSKTRSNQAVGPGAVTKRIFFFLVVLVRGGVSQHEEHICLYICDKMVGDCKCSRMWKLKTILLD